MISADQWPLYLQKVCMDIDVSIHTFFVSARTATPTLIILEGKSRLAVDEFIVEGSTK